MTATALPRDKPDYPAAVYIPGEGKDFAALVRLPSGLFVLLTKGVDRESIRMPEPPLGYVFERGIAVNFGMVSRIEELIVDEKTPGRNGVRIYAADGRTHAQVAIPLLDVARAIDELNADGKMIVSRMAAQDGKPATITLTHSPVNVTKLRPDAIPAGTTNG